LVAVKTVVPAPSCTRLPLPVMTPASTTLGAGGTTGSVPGAITDNGFLTINRSDNFVLNNVSGTGRLQQAGPGVTTLGTGLSYTGGALIVAGTLVVNDPTALGPGSLNIIGGELLAGTTETFQNGLGMGGSDSFTIAAAHETFTTSTTQPWSLAASGQIITFGAPGQDGTVVWNSPPGTTISNSVNGWTVLVQAGTLRPNDIFSANLLLGDDTHTAIRPAGTLDAHGFSFTVNDLRGGGRIINSSGPASLTVNGGTFSGVIDGLLSLEVQGALVLSGNNTYTGGTAIDGGATLTLGNGGTTGSVPGPITDNGTLEFRHSGDAQIFLVVAALEVSRPMDGPT